MQKVFTQAKLRLVLLPLLGAVGAVAAIVYPSGHQAFCAGFSGLVI